MPCQLSAAECDRIDMLVRKRRQTATAAWRQLNSSRERRGVQPLGPDAVYRYVAGATHKRSRSETRGRPHILSAAQIKKDCVNAARVVGA